MTQRKKERAPLAGDFSSPRNPQDDRNLELMTRHLAGRDGRHPGDFRRDPKSNSPAERKLRAERAALTRSMKVEYIRNARAKGFRLLLNGVPLPGEVPSVEEDPVTEEEVKAWMNSSPRNSRYVPDTS
jgi:hypothetical protein